MFSSATLVSCIIPTKNRPELVLRAIESVLCQSHKNVEVLVIDDSTNTDTYDIINGKELPVLYIKNENSRGACYSRNIGIRNSTGEVLAFLDDDDAWLPLKLEKQLELLHYHPLTGCNYVTNIGNSVHRIKQHMLVDYQRLLYHNALGSCSCVAVARKAMDGCFFDENLKAGQDWDMWLSIMKKNPGCKAANSQDFLMDYNSGEYVRISNSVDVSRACMAIYSKYAIDHSDFTTRMFFLYNMLPSGGSIWLWAFRELLKLRMQNKSLFTLGKMIISRINKITVEY